MRWCANRLRELSTHLLKLSCWRDSHRRRLTFAREQENPHGSRSFGADDSAGGVLDLTADAVSGENFLLTFPFIERARFLFPFRNVDAANQKPRSQ